MRRDTPLIIIGNGDINHVALRDIAQLYPIVALDGAYQRVADLGFDCHEIIGDLDSLSKDSQLAARAKGVRLVQIEEQDSNDFEKALYHYEASSYICFGLTGGRFDHTMASLHVMAKYSQDKPVIAITNNEILTIHKGTIQLPTIAEALFAILPIAPISFTQSTGLAYPLDGLRLAIGEMISSSNQATAEMVSLQPAAQDQEQNYVISRPLAMWQKGAFITKG